MANVQISELPDITLPASQVDTYFETQTLESGISVSRKFTLATLTASVGSGIQTITSGGGLTVDATDPVNPIITLDDPVVADLTGDVNGVTLTTGGSASSFLGADGAYHTAGTVTSVNSGDDITVDNTNPAAPIINLNASITAIVNGVTLTTAGSATDFLAADGAYHAVAGGALPAGTQFDLPYISTAPSTYSATSTLQISPATPTLTLKGAAPSENVAAYVASAVGGNLVFQKSRNAVVGSHTIVQSGDALGTISYYGSDGVTFQAGASIQGAVDGTPGAGDMPGRLVFSTTPDGSTTPAEAMRITQAQTVAIIQAGSSFFTPPTASAVIPLLSLQGQTVVQDLYAASGAGARYNFRKSRSGVAGTQTIVQSGDILSDLITWGSDGASFQQAAVFRVSSDGTPGASDMPGRISLMTTPDGQATSLERMRVDNAGRVVALYPGVGGSMTYTTPQDYSSTVVGLTVACGNSAAQSVLAIDTHVSASALGSVLVMRKNRTNSMGSFVVVSSGDTMGSTVFQGSDGAAWQPGAEIRAVVDGTASTGDMPGRLVFLTTPDGTAAVVERARINNGGTTSFIADGSAYVAPQQTGPTANRPAGFALQSTTANFDMLVVRNSNDTGPASYTIAKSRGTVLGAVTIVANADELGRISWSGADGAKMVEGARISAYVNGTPGVDDMPTDMLFWNTPDGSATAVESLRIDRNGYVYGKSFLQAVKLVNTDRASTTVLAADPELTLTVTANTFYAIELYLEASCTIDAPGFKWTLTQPGGNDWFMTGVSKDQANTAVVALYEFGGAPYSIADVNPQHTIMVQGMLHVTTAGTVSIDWSQVASNGTATRLGSASYIKLRRLGT